MRCQLQFVAEFDRGKSGKFLFRRDVPNSQPLRRRRDDCFAVIDDGDTQNLLVGTVIELANLFAGLKQFWMETNTG